MCLRAASEMKWLISNDLLAGERKFFSLKNLKKACCKRCKLIGREIGDWKIIFLTSFPVRFFIFVFLMNEIAFFSLQLTPTRQKQQQQPHTRVVITTKNHFFPRLLAAIIAGFSKLMYKLQSLHTR